MQIKFQPSTDTKTYQHIKKLLLARKLAPGQKLIYRDLEEAIGMSKTPIINALSRLGEEGLVEYKPNRGFYVKQLTSQEIEQLYDLRQRMEEISVEYAIKNYDGQALAEVKEALQQYEAYDSALYDLERFELDVKFHLAISRMGNNAFLISFLKRLYENAYILLNVAVLTPLIPQLKKDHALIYEAIRVKDLNAAIKLIRQHEKSCGSTIVRPTS